MARSLNPNAVENRADSETDSTANDSPPGAETAGENAHRRNFLAAFAASMIGFVLAIFPILAGALVVLDPLLGKKKKKDNFIRISTLASIPPDGTPVQVPVVADAVDAWNRETNQPVGAVYLRRLGDQVIAFNAICPHAGCFVNYAGDRDVFQCPCHTSAFSLEGVRMGDSSPSPRDLDTLIVDEERLAATGEVWVEFVNYYPGKAERVAKA